MYQQGHDDRQPAINQCWKKHDEGWNTLPFSCYSFIQVSNRTKLHRCALLSHHESLWAKLYRCGDASSFLTVTGLSRQRFYFLHDLLFLGHQPQRSGWGRPQLMHSSAQLGLFLFNIGSTMRIKHLCLIFGITPSTCSEILNKMLVLVVHKLIRHLLAW